MSLRSGLADSRLNDTEHGDAHRGKFNLSIPDTIPNFEVLSLRYHSPAGDVLRDDWARATSILSLALAFGSGETK